MHVDRVAERLGELGPNGREMVEHLVGCETCRLRVLMSLREADPREAGRREDLGLPSLSLGPLVAALKRAIHERQQDEDRAQDEWCRALDLPPEEAGAALAETLAGPALAKHLLHSAAMTGESLELLERPAQLVLAVGLVLEQASREDPRPGGAECCGRAWTALGEVARLRGDRMEAEISFGKAAAALDVVELDCEERALFCRLLARLRIDQGRIDEALGLLERASDLYLSRAEDEDVGEVLAEKGRLLLEELDVEGAELALRAAVNLIEAERRPWPAIRARQGLALCAAEKGREDEAARAWWAEIESSAGWTNRERYRATILYGEIAERMGVGGRAVRLLRAAIEGLADLGELYEAAIGTATLLGVLASLRDGEPEVEKRVPRELQEKLSPLARDGNAWTVLSYLFDLAEGKRGPNEIFKVGREYLERARHNPTLAHHPRWRPRAALSWDGLGEASRAEICQLALVDPREVADRSSGELTQGLRTRLAWAYEAYKEIRIVFAEEGSQEEERRESRRNAPDPKRF